MSQVVTLFDEKEAAPRGSTPLMRQYYAIKDQHPNAILLFRMGDFYETFAEDAHTVSQVLGITLTKRSNGKAADVALAGFPHHALDSYLPRLIRAGLRVAVCEQLEDPKKAKTIVKRGVTEIVTPGVSFRDELLHPHRPNYVAALVEDGKGNSGASFLDASTGDFYVLEGTTPDVLRVLQTVSPTELLLSDPEGGVQEQWQRQGVVVTPREGWSFGFEFAYETLVSHFATKSLKGFGVDELHLGISAAGSVLHYVTETQKGHVPHIRVIQRFRDDAHMVLDRQTRRNLDLEETAGGKSLVELLDESRTPMGARAVRRRIHQPLVDVEEINRRLDAVQVLVEDPALLDGLRQSLRGIGDVERLVARNDTGRSQPRDLEALAEGLRRVPTIKTHLAGGPRQLAGQFALEGDTAKIVVLISSALADEPASVGSGGATIREGYHAELDEVRSLARDGKSVIASIQQREAARTGITSLKVGYNKVFGYYLEVTNTHRDKVPADYIRKQTLVNAERYVTPELKETEERILAAQERVGALEAELFRALQLAVAAHSELLMVIARALGQLDATCALACVSAVEGYVRPVVDSSRMLEIEDGRHPVVESALPPGEPFIPNTVKLDPDAEQILVITGPNMAGKSVVLRQTGIIVLMAQVGCFVPASAAHVGVVDRIFTRVGASDNLAEGESTFLVEMNETANILNNATDRSLILLDEVGRGTSTFDGLSIAWAIVEYVHGTQDVAAKTLFATHYHELNELANRLPRVRNFRVLVQEYEGRVVFLRKLVAGGADHSYGIEVARMAGLPDEIIIRAREVLSFLESTPVVVASGGDGAPEVASRTNPDISEVPEPMSAEVSTATHEVFEVLRSLDLNRITPVEALVKLNELKELAPKA